jgi:hypothetical protein
LFDAACIGILVLEGRGGAPAPQQGNQRIGGLWVKLSILFALVAAAALTGCAPKVLNIVATDPYIWQEEGVTIHLPPGTWQVERAPGMHMVVFRRGEEPGRIAIQVTPMHTVGQPLRAALERQLLVEFEHKEVVESSTLIVGVPRGGEPPSQSGCVLVRALVDEKPLLIRVCVLPVGHTVYDLVCWSPPQSFPEVDRLYKEFVKGISFPESSPPASAP